MDRSRSRSPVDRRIRSERFSHRDAPYRRDSRRDFRFLFLFSVFFSAAGEDCNCRLSVNGGCKSLKPIHIPFLTSRDMISIALKLL